MSTCKVQRTESLADLTTSTMSLHPIPTEHPHKIPDVTAQKTSSVGKDRRSTDRSPLDVEKSIKPSVEKDSGLPFFIPLSIGKNLGDLWWSIDELEFTTERFGRIKVFYTIDNSRLHLYRAIFRVSFEDMQHILYMFSMALIAISGEVDDDFTPPSESSWYKEQRAKLEKEYQLEDFDWTSVKFFTLLNERLLKSPLAMKWKRKIFFAKKPHTRLLCKELGQESTVTRKYRATMNGENKFDYEIRCRIFPLFVNEPFPTRSDDDEHMSGDEVPASQSLS